MIKKDRSIEEIKENIEEELASLKRGYGGYSRNIIGMELRIIDKKFGTESANKVIDDLKLEKYGFNKE